ncbi:ArsA family ATPase [Streptomyces fuscigenes]|uniref:ArsA family ATPase n=1 Tax=Streptomyces fuscigenes TaxID=1528880 RepID=UPI001F2BC697|nr:ArsA-related P-loop ATPase [Streptomyces fuscigenes]MCF3962774.1 ArsA family ATPase [Streptomyces fuscigenes]
MAPRTVLVTGLGGAGRTTVAAATALAATRRGDRTLLLTADGAAAAALLGAGPGPRPDEPAAVADGLWAARIDTDDHFRTELLDLQERIAPALDLLGAPRLRREELTTLPGSDRFALLHALRVAAAGDWDALVVDLPPLGEALAALTLPGELRRYLRRLLPPERQAARALRPVMAQLAGVPLPSRRLYEAATRKDTELAAAQLLIEDAATAVRLVLEPGPAAEEALRTARIGLALHGLRADAVVASKVLPPAAGHPWLEAAGARQRKTLDAWHGDPAPGPELHELPHLGHDPQGPGDLAALDVPAPGDRAATPYGGGRPAGHGDAAGGEPGTPAPEPWWVEDLRASEGLLVWCLPLPGAVKSELSLVRREGELLLTVGPFRRIVPLTSALRRCTVSGAALTDGVLRVRFAPDPALWPKEGS